MLTPWQHKNKTITIIYMVNCSEVTRAPWRLKSSPVLWFVQHSVKAKHHIKQQSSTLLVHCEGDNQHKWSVMRLACPLHNVLTWWRHQMETFSALLAICAGNSPVTGEFPAQMPVTRSFDVFVDLRLNKRFSKQSRSLWFETLSRPLWRHCNDVCMITDDWATQEARASTGIILTKLSRNIPASTTRKVSERGFS